MTSTHQLSLFEPLAHVRREDPDTSEQASRLHAKYHRGQCRKILDILQQARSPMAAEEVAMPIGLTEVQVARRWADMVRDGLVRATTQRHKTRSGCWSVRYELGGGA